jgi:hypothetical protein
MQTLNRKPSQKVDVDRTARAWEDALTCPKAAMGCHLLPFWERKTATVVPIRSIDVLREKSMPAGLRPLDLGRRRPSRQVGRNLVANVFGAIILPMSHPPSNGSIVRLADDSTNRGWIARVPIRRRQSRLHHSGDVTGSSPEARTE